MSGVATEFHAAAAFLCKGSPVPDGRLAQRLERSPHTREVKGSNPLSPTILSSLAGINAGKCFSCAGFPNPSIGPISGSFALVPSPVIEYRRHVSCGQMDVDNLYSPVLVANDRRSDTSPPARTKLAYQ